MSGQLVSYHPALEADENLLLVSQRALGPQDEEALRGAAAVFLPQVCRPDLHALVQSFGLPHFPRPACQLTYNGKVGNHRLFAELGLPQPATLEFSGLELAVAAWREGGLRGLEPPLVAKGAAGGEGRNVYLVHSPEDLEALGPRLETASAFGPAGLILQQYVESQGRDMRVLIIGDELEAFWRIGAPGEFRANLSQGGRVERGERPRDLERGKELAEALAKWAGIDLAAVDLLHPLGADPLLLEINFYFGRSALGGEGPFLGRLLAAARRWLQARGLDPSRVSLAEDL